MAAVTAVVSAGVALAGLGMSIAQTAKENKKAKEAEAAASAAAKQIASVKETNAFNAVKVPTLGFDLAQQGLDRATAAALGAAQGAGAEGVLGAAGNIVQAQGAANLDLAAQAGDMEFQRDLYKATAQGNINQRQADREESLGLMRLQGAQQAKATAEARKAEAISSAIGYAGSALSYGAEAAPLYGSKNPGAGAPGSFKGTTVQTQQEYLDEQNKNKGMNLLGR